MANAPANRALVLFKAKKQKTTALARSKTPIVPPGSVTGRSLTLVIAIMCFLACLTAGVVHLVRQSAAAWVRDIDSEVTVQVQPPQQASEMPGRVAAVVQFISGYQGVTKVTPLPPQDMEELVRPWLGKVASLEALPMPQLIAIEIDRSNPPDLKALSAGLAENHKDASLDDHRRWRKQIRAVTGSLAVAGLAIIALVVAATLAIIVAATRSAMASNREIIEVLNFVGAEEKFIVRQFESHFLKLGIKAGLVGALAAGGIFYAAPFVADWFGGAAAADAEIRRFMGSGALDATGYGILAFMVAVIAILCQMTSRYGVRRILEAQNR